jgi:Ca2+-binding RTX toxin-like protein
VRKEGNQMRTPTILIALMSVMVVVFASVALAEVINGDDNDNRLEGTPNADTIKGQGGNDRILGRGGDDQLKPGSGLDIVSGGSGNDLIRAVDRQVDLIACGAGFDRVKANPGDEISRGPEATCEKVIRKGMEARGPG